MKSNLEPPTQEVLAGLVERVTFHNAENGLCVLRPKARGHRDLVTVVGRAAIISAGEWINDRAHGQQFKARFLKTSAPSSIDGIERPLCFLSRTLANTTSAASRSLRCALRPTRPPPLGEERRRDQFRPGAGH